MGWLNDVFGGWSQSGNGKHDKVEIQSNTGDSIVHVTNEDKYTGGTKTVSAHYSSDGEEIGHTTIHGNGHVNKHGSHKD